MVYRGGFAIICAMLFLAADAAVAQNFTVLSDPDRHPIHGQTDLPAARDPRAVVVFLPGSGNHSRDFEFSNPESGLPAFVFRDLSLRLTKAGFATVRYDERGVSCVGKARPPGRDDRCHDATAAQTITMDTNTADVEAVIAHASAGPGGRCVILLGHSEGFYHIGRLVDRRGLRPAGIIGVGAPLESLQGVGWSQSVDTLPRSLQMADLDNNGRVAKAEFIQNLPHTPLAGTAFNAIAWPEGFSWPEQGLTEADITAIRHWRVDSYRKDRAELMSKPAGELIFIPVNGRPAPRSSVAWFQTFYTDWTPVGGMLASYDGPIHLFYGTLDSSVEPHRQVAVARQLLGKARLEATITPGLGHTLGAHPKFGPMRADRQDAIVASGKRISDNCGAAP